MKILTCKVLSQECVPSLQDVHGYHVFEIRLYPNKVRI